MSNHTVIPAAPGTSLLEVWIEYAADAKPQIDECAVLAWRISNEVDGVMIAVAFGVEEQPVEVGSWVVNHYGHASIMGLQRSDGWVSHGMKLQPRADFIKKASADLIEHLAEHLSKTSKVGN